MEQNLKQLRDILTDAHENNVRSLQTSHDTAELVSRIERVTLDLVRAIALEEPLQLFYVKPNWNNVEYTDRLKMRDDIGPQVLTFAESSHRQRLVLAIQVLAQVRQLLTTGSEVTQRELFYQMKSMASSQSTLCVALELVARALGVPAWEMGVLTSSKGRVVGPLTIRMTSETLVCSTATGISVPNNIFRLAGLDCGNASFVLLVEKDAVFQKLLDEGFLFKFQHGILVTGKGYPDVCTRQLIRAIWDFLRLPVLALVDADPHGFEIMCNYRFGSLAMADRPELAVPAVRWLGVHPSDIVYLGLVASGGTEPLTDSDRARLHKILSRPYMGNKNPALAEEIQKLLSLGVKAEIEAVINFSPSYLTDNFLPNKIERAYFI